MKPKTRAPGRPKNKNGTITLWSFARAGMIMSAFDETRASGEKHSVAVTEAVNRIRQRHPEMPVSESEVRRTLAKYRPTSSRTILRFQRSILDDAKLARLRCMLEKVDEMQRDKGPSVTSPSGRILLKSRTAYVFGYKQRPLYPRHNRKIPNN
jgi:hypothetical protein